MGAAVTLEETIHLLRSLTPQQPAYGAMVNHMERIAGEPLATSGYLLI